MLMLAFIAHKVNRVAPGIVSERKGERERSAETERERERASVRERESAIVINVEHAHCLRTARLPATSSIATQKPAKGKFKRQEEAEEGN